MKIFRYSDVGLVVTPLRDGTNPRGERVCRRAGPPLIPAYCYCQPVGAANELTSALIVNLNDRDEGGGAQRALTMPLAERNFAPCGNADDRVPKMTLTAGRSVFIHDLGDITPRSS